MNPSPSNAANVIVYKMASLLSSQSLRHHQQDQKQQHQQQHQQQQQRQPQTRLRLRQTQIRFPMSSSCLLFVTIFLLLDYFPPGARAGTNWDHLSLRYGTWYQPPRSPNEARAMGYRRVNGICLTATYHGFLYVHPNNDKARLIFDHNHQLSGIQTAIRGNMRGFNSLNQTIKVPNDDIIPPILLSKEMDSSRVQIYTITAYFKHPSLICSPLNRQEHPEKGLYIQTGYLVEKQFDEIPLDARRLSSDWKTGTCLPMMGNHYFKWLSPDMPCERLYPVFLMYNGEGQLGGFGWLFQGTPDTESPRSLVKWLKLTPQFYPALFDPAMLPSCMSNPEFRVFGIRIYLRNKDTMTCPEVQDDDDDNDDDDDEHDSFHTDEGNNNNFHHHRRNHNHRNKNGNGNGIDSTGSSQHHHRHKSGTGPTGGKPVVKIPSSNHNSNHNNNHNNNNQRNSNPGNDKWDYLGPSFNVRGTNVSGGHPHRPGKKTGKSIVGNNRKDIIVDEDKFRGHSACVKPFNLFSLLVMTWVSYQIYSQLSPSSSASPLFSLCLYLSSKITSSLSSLSSMLTSSTATSFSPVPIFDQVRNYDYYNLPSSLPSYLYYCLCTIIATVPFNVKSPSFLSSSSSSPFSLLSVVSPTTITHSSSSSSSSSSLPTYSISLSSPWVFTIRRCSQAPLSFLAPFQSSLRQLRQTALRTR